MVAHDMEVFNEVVEKAKATKETLVESSRSELTKSREWGFDLFGVLRQPHKRGRESKGFGRSAQRRFQLSQSK